MVFWRLYHFGIKARAMLELLQRSDRLLFTDTDMYPVGDPSKGFQSISPTHSFMRLCEGTHRIYQNKLPGKNIRIGSQVLTRHEPMASLASIGKTSAPWWTPSLRLRQFAKSPIHGHQSSFALGLLCSKRDRRSAHTVCRSGTTTRGARRLSRSRASMHFSTPTGPPRLAGRFWKQPDIACGELR